MCVFSTFSSLVSFKCCANLGNPSMSPWYGASCGGYSSSRCAGRSSGGWDHSPQPKKWDTEHERNCTVCGENNYFDRARCRGCKEHVGKLLQKTAADSGKRSRVKGTGASLDQEAFRGTQHAKMKAETQEKLKTLEKTVHGPSSSPGHLPPPSPLHLLHHTPHTYTLSLSSSSPDPSWTPSHPSPLHTLPRPTHTQTPWTRIYGDGFEFYDHPFLRQHTWISGPRGQPDQASSCWVGSLLTWMVSPDNVDHFVYQKLLIHHSVVVIYSVVHFSNQFTTSPRGPLFDIPLFRCGG